jgi:homoserine/homoserine lactone efflux protein
MSFATWITFVIAGVLIAISPGSGAILSMSHGLAYGVRKASATVLGLQLGLLTVLAVAGAGVGTLLLASDWAFALVKGVGAVYLIYLGVLQWRARVAPDAGPVRVAAAAVPPMRTRVLTGFLTNATNPKGILFMVAVLPQFINRAAPLLPQLGILALTMLAIDSVVMHGYAWLAASMQGLFRSARAQRLQNRFFGAVLMLLGGALFFVRRVAQA